MRHLTIILFLSVFFILPVAAQDFSSGINYQAVARNIDGEVIPDKDLSVRISILSDVEVGAVAYREVHEVTTNKLGLFNLVLGQGFAELGDWNTIPWAKSEIWLDVEIDFEGRFEYIPITKNRLYAVPYAMHAITADQLSNASDPAPPGEVGEISGSWSTKGNFGTDPNEAQLGTTDRQNLKIITNNKSRIVISKGNGQVNVRTPLLVSRQQPTELTGSLEVGGKADFSDRVFIDGDGQDWRFTYRRKYGHNAPDWKTGCGQRNRARWPGLAEWPTDLERLIECARHGSRTFHRRGYRGQQDEPYNEQRELCCHL